MAGLQRSGATAISSILNQNPDVYASPSSPLFPMLTKASEAFKLPQNVDYNRDSGISAVVNNIANNFYSDHEQKYIIDKNHCRDHNELRCCGGFPACCWHATSDTADDSTALTATLPDQSDPPRSCYARTAEKVP